jgi:hypothetical protein
MDLVRKWGLVFTVGCLLGAQTVDDPVVKARLARAQAQGIEEAELPPVPRGVTEPPPLPPPEIHAKDVPGARVAKPSKRRGGKLRAGRQPRGAAVAAAPATPTPKIRAAKRARPAGKVARRTGKRGKA